MWQRIGELDGVSQDPTSIIIIYLVSVTLLMEEIPHHLMYIVDIPVFIGLYTFQTAQDFFHQQYQIELWFEAS